MLSKSVWIKAHSMEVGKVCVFIKNFHGDKIARAELQITAKGVYYAELNGKRVGDFIMAPGWTQYNKRLQVQTYDVTNLIQADNVLEVTVAAGWYAGRINWWYREGITQKDLEHWKKGERKLMWEPAMIAQVLLKYENGEEEIIGSDGSWQIGKGPLLFSELWDGEVFDANLRVEALDSAIAAPEEENDTLILQEGEIVCEHERFHSERIFTTPKGERVIDFGQNLTGYPEVSITAKSGESLSISFAETLDKNGNFYNENYRSAKCEYRYICRDGAQIFKPRCTFYGFRYIRIDEFPKSAELTEETFTAVAVYSKIRQTGQIATSNEKINQLFSNILWGQRSNFLDVPTDCPQRDERFGWTADAQVFCKAASYNYDVLKFFRKWLRDMFALQKTYGAVGFTVPRSWNSPIAAGWSDAAVIVPWQIYRVYGDKELLEELVDMMQEHVEMIRQNSEAPDVWRGGKNLTYFGDWLATDWQEAVGDEFFTPDEYHGGTHPHFIQTAFYAYDVQLVAEALKALGRDDTPYRLLFEQIKTRFQREYPIYRTQTECALALRFGLTPNAKETAKLLEEKIKSNGNKLSTGFLGTPHILHALSENGNIDLAYTLLLQEEFPSWLYSVNLGATTMWEHWDSITPEGRMWSTDMNSFNHYAYGAVADWIYEVAAGIRQENKSAGFESIVVEPHPDPRFKWLEASIDISAGRISSKWIYTVEGHLRYEITVPKSAKIILDGKTYSVKKGTHVFIKKSF